MVGSWKRPGLVTSAKCVSNSWTTGSAVNPLTASRCAGTPLCLGTRARPVENWPSIRASVEVVVVGFDPGGGTGLQPVILPPVTKFSLNRKRAAVSVPFWLITKSEVGLNTMPVGEDAWTSSGTLAIGVTPFAPEYRVMFVSWSSGLPLSEAGLNWLFTHNGVGVFFGPKAMPHGFLTFESVRVAIPGMSETRLTWRNIRLSPWAFAEV